MKPFSSPRSRPRNRSDFLPFDFRIDYEDEDENEHEEERDGGHLGLILLAVMAVLVLAAIPGCKSRPMGPYTEPRVEGRVVSADKSQPLAGVRVSRGKPHGDTSLGSPKGGQLLMVRPPAETGPDGRFELSSERVLSVFRGSGWSDVQLMFEKPGYLPLQTNFSAMIATNSPDGEPLVDVGTVLLQPAKQP